MHVLLLISTQQSIFTLNLLIFFCHVHRKCNKRNIFKYCRFVTLFIKMKTLESKMFVILKRNYRRQIQNKTQRREGAGRGSWNWERRPRRDQSIEPGVWIERPFTEWDDRCQRLPGRVSMPPELRYILQFKGAILLKFDPFTVNLEK